MQSQRGELIVYKESVLNVAVREGVNVFTVSDMIAAKVEGPPSLRAQKRSGLEAASAVTNFPEAVTASNEST